MLALAAGLTLAPNVWAQQSTPTDEDLERARAMVQQSAVDVIGVWKDPQLDWPAKKREIAAIARSNFDFKLMSKLVLRKSWRDLDPEERERFTAEFSQMLIRRYRGKLVGSDVKEVRAEAAQPTRKADALVRTTLRGGTDDGAEITYRLRLRNGEWKAIDAIVEGVSILESYREQFVPMLDQDGTAEVLQWVAERNRESGPAAVGAGPD